MRDFMLSFMVAGYGMAWHGMEITQASPSLNPYRRRCTGDLDLDLDGDSDGDLLPLKLQIIMFIPMEE